MYQKKGQKFQRELIYKALFVIFVVICGTLITYLLISFKNMRNDFDLFFDGFDVESSLIDENYINYAFLSQRAQQIEELIEMYHIPYDMTGEGWDYYPPVGVAWSYSSAKFYNNSQLLATFDPLDPNSTYNDKKNMTYSGDRGHTALYEGVYCAGEAFRYAWAKRHNNIANMKAAENTILKIVKAYDLLSNVSDKSIFVRYAVPNTTLAYKMFPGHWETKDHDVVEYRGYKWSLSRHLSRDVTIGIMFGLSMSYMLVDNAQIRAIAGRIIEKTVQYLYDCNWRIIDTDGTQHTSSDFISMRPFMEGDNILTFLQMGKMVNPEKWGPIYHHYAYDRGLAENIGRSMRIGIDLAPKIYSGYYGCNFVYNNAPSLIFLEMDPKLKEIYIRNWLNVLHDFTKLHRNANFDAVYLLCHAAVNLNNLYAAPKNITLKNYDLEIWKDANIKNPWNAEYIKQFMIRDIKDALMRYALLKYPNRNYYFATAPGTFPNSHQTPLKISGYTIPYPKYKYWAPSSPGIVIINGILGLIGEGSDATDLLDNSLPADMRKCEDIMWQRSSFQVETTQQLPENPGNFQAPMGPEYLAVYWMAKYLELF